MPFPGDTNRESCWPSPKLSNERNMNVFSPPVRPRSPLLAGLFSLLVPGLGQLYNGQPFRAISLFLCEMLIGALLVIGFSSFRGVLAGLCVFVLFMAVVVGDAARSAAQRRDYTLRKSNRGWMYLLFACLSLGTTLQLDWILSNHFYQTFRVPSASMEPTLLAGDRFMAARLRSDTPVKRHDVVVFHPPGMEEQYYVKRVIALPGETVSVRRGRTVINGARLQEPQARLPRPGESIKGDLDSFRLGPDQYWLMGDNRGKSFDSRFFGPVSRDRIGYKALYLYWASAPAKGRWDQRFGMRLD